MADKEVLSQEEIDALLNSVDTSEDASEEAEEISMGDAAPGSGGQADELDAGSDKTRVVAHYFANQARIIRGELPVLEKIHDRACRFFINDLYLLMSRELEVKQEALTVIKHKEFMGQLSNPTLISVYRFKPLRGKMLVMFDSIFVYDLVDYYFGGNIQFSPSKNRTDYTATEIRVMEIVIKKFIECIHQAWLPIIELEQQHVAEETNPQLVHLAEPEEMLLVSRFHVNFGKEVGNFAIAMPYTMVEPIKQLLEMGATRPDDEIDPNWINSLRDELMEVPLSIRAILSKTTCDLKEVMNWQKGDFIPMDIPEIVTMDIEETPAFQATVGTANDKRALKIIEKTVW